MSLENTKQCNTEQKRCADCGEYVFFGQHVWSSNDNGQRTHHADCESAAERAREMPIYYDRLVQALVEIQERTGIFVSQSDDEEYEDPELLQRVVLDVYEMATTGIEATHTARESCS